MKRLYPSLSLFVFAMMTAPTTSLACTACFYGDPDDPANKSLRASVIVLLLFILGLLGLFARFFINVRRRSQLTES